VIRGFALTIAGVPYVFTTDGVTALPTSTSPLWWGAESGVVVAHGVLGYEGLRVAERARPLAGELEVDAITFRLRDPVASSGLASGYSILTRLATLDSTEVTSTPLASTATAIATTITVGAGGVVTGSAWVWVGREAMSVTSVVSNTVTVGRGALGTKARAHLVDDVVQPEVFTSVPWVQRRKVVLWRVDDAGVATPVWQGFCVRAPKLVDDGRAFDLPCDPYLQVLGAAPIAPTYPTVRLVGYGQQTTGIGSPVLGVQIQVSTNLPATATSTGTVRTWDELTGGVEARALSGTTDRGTGVAAFISRVGANARVDIDSNPSVFWAGVTWLGTPTSTELVPSRNRGSTREFLSLDFGPIPSVAYVFFDGSPLRLAVTSVDGLPTVWGWSTTDTGTDYATSTRDILRVEHSREMWADALVHGEASAGVWSPALNVAEMRLTPRAWSAPTQGSTTLVRQYRLTDPPPAQVATMALTQHWAWGLRRAALPLADDCEPEDDWDWSTLPAVVAATRGYPVARSWTFDGRRTVDSLLSECCLLSGVTPVMRSGRAALHPWAWPSVSATPDATLTATDIIGTPVWSVWDDGLANRLELQGPGLQIVTVDQGSVARYGPGHPIAVTLAGVDAQGPVSDDPYVLARQALARLSLWADPLPTVRVVVSLEHVGVELGHLVAVTDWITPDGAGDRGITARRGVVYGREVDFLAATVTLELLLFPRVSYGYAPCARVLSVVSSTVVDIDATPVGSYDYAGGTDGLGGTGTGVQSLFAAGDRVQLLTRDSTTLTSEDRIIDTVTWTGTEWRIAFTVALSAGMQTAIGAGPVDIRGSSYATAGLTAAQGLFMHVADETTLVIDSTAEPARRIAP
jgi:hypothetical protein